LSFSFLCTLGVNVNISNSINDVGVQCDLISLPLLTSTPTQCIESEEEDDIILPQDHGEDNLSQSWGDITEEPIVMLTAVRPQRLMSSNIVSCKSLCTILRYTKLYSNCILLSIHQTCTICSLL